MKSMAYENMKLMNAQEMKPLNSLRTKTDCPKTWNQLMLKHEINDCSNMKPLTAQRMKQMDV